jgi:hypothetical protein
LQLLIDSQARREGVKSVTVSRGPGRKKGPGNHENQGRREGGEAVIFTGPRPQKGAQESEIYLFLSHISKFYRGPGQNPSFYGPDESKRRKG